MKGRQGQVRSSSTTVHQHALLRGLFQLCCVHAFPGVACSPAPSACCCSSILTAHAVGCTALVAGSMLPLCCLGYTAQDKQRHTGQACAPGTPQPLPLLPTCLSVRARHLRTISPSIALRSSVVRNSVKYLASRVWPCLFTSSTNLTVILALYSQLVLTLIC